MTDKEKINKIKNIIAFVANNVFWMKGDFRYVNAYDKLKARVLLDWDFSINDRLRNSNSKENSMFDVLCADELDMVLESSIRLMNMYNEVKRKKTI